MLVIQEFNTNDKVKVIDTLISKGIKFKLGYGSYQSSMRNVLVTYSQMNESDLLINALEMSRLVQYPVLLVNDRNVATLINVLDKEPTYHVSGVLCQVSCTRACSYACSLLFDGLLFTLSPIGDNE